MQSVGDAHHAALLYKGKVTGRSWPQLPEEIVRLIATHYLLEVAYTSYCPQTWEARRLWPNRTVYTCIRDANDLEKHLMSICPEWHRAIAKHLFWKHVMNVIDCNDLLTHHMVIHPKLQLNASSNAIPQPIYLTPFRHVRNLLNCSCHVCRLNYPYTNSGLAAAKRTLSGSLLGTVHLCREHDRRRAHFCGLCLRDSIIAHNQDATTRDYDVSQAIGILENEDEDTWPGVESTCKRCRVEWLWRRASGDPRDREAIGGPNLQSDDWETRQCIENFVDLAEGSISDVLTLAREKLWLKRNTRYESLGQHALAAQKTTRDEQEEEEEAEDSEEDRELMLMRDANQVREMALHDWARKRILDGHWLCPADSWYHFNVPGQPTVVRALHPCPWAREVNGEPATDADEEHPTQATATSDIPPTFGLCEQAYAAYMKQMREVLNHPLRNIVRKIIMECAIPTPRGYEDPGHKASRMSIEDVVAILREEELIWYDGVDWVERRRNEEETSRRRALEAANATRLEHVDMKDRHCNRKEDDADSTTSSSSSSGDSAKYSRRGSSNATSPVLSTSTLQTTPSPPPLSDDGPSMKKEDEDDTPQQRQQQSLPSRPRIIPFDPVRSTPVMLSSIPYVPLTTAHLPQYSLDALKSVWRDACAPLYHCRCSICERAKMADAAARAAYANAHAAPVVPSQQPAQQQQPLRTTLYPQNTARPAQTVDAAEIELKEVSEIELDGDGEDEVDYDGSDLEYEDDDDEVDPRYLLEGDEEYRFSSSPEAEVLPTDAHNKDSRSRSRKRSSDELEREEEVDEDRTLDGSVSSDSPTGLHRPDQRELGGTPPKRPRIGERESPPDDGDNYSVDSFDDPTATMAIITGVVVNSQARSRKRSSEELEGGDERPSQEITATSKRAKVDASRTKSRDVSLVQSPTSTNGEDLSSSHPDEDEDDASYNSSRGGWIRQSDMDGLIQLDDVDE